MRRRFGLIVGLALLLPLGTAASASAQGNTIQVTPKVVSPGTLVTVTGSFYTLNAGSSGVDIRLNTRDGLLLVDDVIPATNGRIEAAFEWPAGVSPGTHLMMAVQTYNRGRHLSAGRTRIKVVAAGAAAAAPAGADRPGPGGSVPAPVVILGLILLAAGLLLTSAAAWTRTRPKLGS
ncbi:MAG: hypothetical protein H0W98_05175 [Chloroflexi bacterium]|nr:hypothetical protein [Chloroflexota bacterium]